jgi:asparagine synthetase A
LWESGIKVEEMAIKMIEKYICNKKGYYESIKEARDEIASLKEKKATWRNDAWTDATGTAKEKEDYVKSVVAGIDSEIARCEADIELYYNQVKILDDKIELEYLSDDQ